MCRCRTWYEINVFVDNGVCRCTSVHHELHKQEFIQCEDWMLAGGTSKRIPFNSPRSTNKTSRRFDFANSSITASESSVMIEIGKKLGGGRGLRRRWVWSGVFPSQVGMGSGEGLCPLPRKFLRFLRENGAFWLHFLPYAIFFSQFKGGGAWPKWPNGKYYATGLGLARAYSLAVHSDLCTSVP